MKLILLLLLGSTMPVFGQLKWDHPEQVFVPKPQETVIETKYRFTNIGTSKIAIDEVRTSCGCTTTTLSKKVYAPGESGEIGARFVFAGRIGHQEKWILVTTSLAPFQPIVLRLIANIPETVTVQPEFLMWQIGDPPQSKTLRVHVGDQFPGKIVSVQADNPALKIELNEVRPGKELEVKVTPTSTAAPLKAILSVITDYPSGNPVIHQAYARVE